MQWKKYTKNVQDHTHTYVCMYVYSIFDTNICYSICTSIRDMACSVLPNCYVSNQCIANLRFKEKEKATEGTATQLQRDQPTTVTFATLKI